MAFVEEPPPLGAGALGEAVRVHWAAVREPQSAQSVPQVHAVYSEPRPPSSQSPSLAAEHVFEQPLPELEPVGAGAEGDGKVVEATHEPRLEQRPAYALAKAEQVVTPLKAVKLRVQPGIEVATDAYDALTEVAVVAQTESYEAGYAAAADAADWQEASMALAAWRWRPILARCFAAMFISVDFLSWRRMAR